MNYGISVIIIFMFHIIMAQKENPDLSNTEL